MFSVIMSKYSKQVIMGNSSSVTDFVYFVTQGEARVVRDYVLMKERHAGGKIQWHFIGRHDPKLKVIQAEQGRRKKAVRRLLTVTGLTKGMYFGCGMISPVNFTFAFHLFHCK